MFVRLTYTKVHRHVHRPSRASPAGSVGRVTDVDRRRATSFGSQAEDYSRYRPAPLAEAAAWAASGAPGTVVDLAAGTGGLTRHLVELGAPVVAIDIDPRMLAVLGRRVPGVVRAAAMGEAIPLRAGVAGAVVISSAWHWLDHDRAWPELARVLGPGATLAVVSSGPDRTVPWVGDVLGHRSRAGGEASGWWSRRRRVELPEAAAFAEVEERDFAGHVPYPVADLPLLVASYSQLIVLSAEERQVAMDEVAAKAAARPELAGLEIVDLPLRCRVWKAVRS